MTTANKWIAALIVGISVILFASVVSAQIDMTAKRAAAVLACRSQANWQYTGIDGGAGKSRRWAYAICMTQRGELPRTVALVPCNFAADNRKNVPSGERTDKQSWPALLIIAGDWLNGLEERCE